MPTLLIIALSAMRSVASHHGFLQLLCRVWTRSRRETTAPSQEVVLGRTRTFVGLMTHRESRALEFMQNVFKEIGSQVHISLFLALFELGDTYPHENITSAFMYHLEKLSSISEFLTFHYSKNESTNRRRSVWQFFVRHLCCHEF